MILTLCSLLWAAPLEIKHDIQKSYLSGNHIVVTLQLYNKETTPITIPDLSQQTWRTQFTLTHSSGKKEIRSNAKSESTATWTLPAQSTRTLMLEIPSSAGLKNGAYSMDMTVDYQLDTYQTHHRFTISPASLDYVDIDRDILGSVRALWTDKTTQGTYLNTGTEQYRQHDYAHKPKLCRSAHLDYCAFGTENGLLYLNRDQQQRIPIPYPDAQILGRVSVAYNHAFVPIRTTQKQLLLLQISNKGLPSFRKLRRDIPAVTHTDTTLSSLGEPLYLFTHARGVEIARITAPSQSNLPQNTYYIHKNTAQQQVLSARFGVHPDHGLSVLVLYQQTLEDGTIDRCLAWYSLSGSGLTREDGIALPEGSLIDAYASPPSWLVHNEEQWVYVDKTGIQPLDISTGTRCRINKKGVVCFTKGKWEIVYTLPTK